MFTLLRRRLAPFLPLACLLVGACARPLEPSDGAPKALEVFAPWSLEKRLRRVVEVFQEHAPCVPVRLRTGTPGQLLSRVKAGARPHVYIAMGPAEIEALDSLKLTAPGSAKEFLKQTLVLAVSAQAQDRVRDLRDLADKDVAAVGIGQPALESGRLTRAALRTLGILDVVEPKARTSPLRALVMGTVAAAVLYEQCAYDEDLFVGQMAPVRGIATLKPLPRELCEPFPLVAVAIGPGRAHPAAETFIRTLGEKRAQDILHRRGEWSCPICAMEP